MNMEHKLALGVLPDSAKQVVGVTGTYHVAPMETPTGTVELLRLPKPGGGSYYVEYRRPLGVFDSQAPQYISPVSTSTRSRRNRSNIEQVRHRADRHASDDAVGRLDGRMPR